MILVAITNRGFGSSFDSSRAGKKVKSLEGASRQIDQLS